MAWYLVPSLVAFRDEANRLYPNRDRSSDGSIGDTAHSARRSDHNPDSKGAVHAYDLDEDLDGDGTDRGAELAALAEHLRVTRDARVKYVIYEGRMFASYATASRPAWTWGPYSGVNAHRKHMHVSVLSTEVGETDTGPWFPQVQLLIDDDEGDDVKATLVRARGDRSGAYWAVTADGRRWIRTQAEANILFVLGQLHANVPVDLDRTQVAAIPVVAGTPVPKGW